MTHRRLRLARRRKSLGFTQEGLAAELRVERSTVVRWERGDQVPQPWVRLKLATALQLSPEQLDDLLVEPDNVAVGTHTQPEPAETDDMNRRELLRLFSITSTSLALPPVDTDVDRIASAAHHQGGLDAATVDEYAYLNNHLWRVFTLAPAKSRVLPIVRNQLDVLSNGLRQPQAPVVRERLCHLTADLFQLAGEIFFDGTVTPTPPTATPSPPPPGKRLVSSTSGLVP